MSNRKNKETSRLWMNKILLLVFFDVLTVLAAYFMALLLRFDFVFSSIPTEYIVAYAWSMPFWIISTIVVFYLCRLYHSIWNGQRSRASDDSDCVYDTGSRVFCGYAVYGYADAEILLFYRICTELLYDNRHTFFLSSAAFLYKQPCRVQGQ